MSRVRQYLDEDVLTAARARLRHVYETFDSVAVAFSGGKDSLAVLHLARELVTARSPTAKVNVIFRDEELIPDEVINFVAEYRTLPWVNMLWFCVPLKSTKFVLGVTREYVQWDPNRAHVRPMPEWAIRLPEGDLRVFDQYSMDAFTASYFRGKVAVLTGIRASESIMRYRACVNKLNENYINATDSPNVKLVKPIFDWEENDVFRYFYDHGIRYCPIYDVELYARSNLRVSTPLHAEAAKKFGLVRKMTPGFYERLVAVFPEMLAHERYYDDLDADRVKAQYGSSFDGVRAWIIEHIDDEAQQRLALQRLGECETMARRQPESYPPDYVLHAMMKGQFKRVILPKATRSEKG